MYIFFVVFLMFWAEESSRQKLLWKSKHVLHKK